MRWSPSIQTVESSPHSTPEYLEPDQLKEMLGPRAFVCAASHAYDLPGTEVALHSIEGPETMIANNGQEFLVDFADRQSRDWVRTPNQHTQKVRK